MFILRIESLILSVSCVTSAAIPDGQVVGSYQVRFSAACEIEADLSAGEIIEDNMVETGAAGGGIVVVVVVVEDESIGVMDDASARARNETFSVGASLSWSETRQFGRHPTPPIGGKEKERESLLNPVGAELAPFDETCPDFLVVRSKSSRRLSKK